MHLAPKPEIKIENRNKHFRIKNEKIKAKESSKCHLNLDEVAVSTYKNYTHSFLGCGRAVKSRDLGKILQTLRH